MALGDRWSTSLVAAGAGASLIATLGFATAGAQGYWEDPFASVAPWTWVAWGATVALAWTSVLAGARGSHQGAGAALLLGSLLQLGLLARSKGMVASDGGDIMTHAGWVVDLLREETLPPILYPGMHAWAGAWSLMTGLPPLATLETLFIPLMVTTFALGCGLAGRFALRDRAPGRGFAVGIGVGSLPLAVLLKSLPIANHWAFLLLPLTVVALLRALDPGTRRGAPWMVAAACFVATLALGHPLMTPVVVLAVLGIATVASLARHPSWRGHRRVAILAVATLVILNTVIVGLLLFSSTVGERLIRQAQEDRAPDLSTGTPVGRQLDDAQGLGFDWADILRVALVSYVPIGLVAALAAIGVAWVAVGRGRRTSLPLDHLIAVVACIGLVLLAIGVSTRFLGDLGIRAGRFIEYGGPLLVGAACVGLAANGLWRRMSWVPLVAVLLVSGAGLAGAYKSPLAVQAWDAVPPSELVGASWYMSYKAEKPVFTGPASGAYRYGTLFFGTEGLKEERPDLYQYPRFGFDWPNHFPKTPDHFGFEGIDYVCGGASTGRTALVFLPVGDLEPYLDGAYSVTGRFDPEDLEDWGSPDGGFRVYDSGPRQVQIYTTPPHCSVEPAAA